MLRAQGKPQRYGTQFDRDKAHPGVLVAQPMVDPAHVDAWRAQVGLPPSRDYACVLSKMYRTKVRVPSVDRPAAVRH